MNPITIDAFNNIPDADYSTLDGSFFQENNGANFFKKATSLNSSRGSNYINFVHNYRICKYGPEGHLPAEFTTEYNQICQDPLRRVFSIAYNGDLVLVPVKKVLMYDHVYNRIEGVPVSVNGNQNNVKDVLKELARTKICKKINTLCSSEQELVESIGGKQDIIIDSYNFYSSIESTYQKLHTNKWLTKRGIKKIMKMNSLELTIEAKVTRRIQDSVELILDGFDEYQEKYTKYESGWKKLSKSIRKNKNFDNVFYLMGWYQNIPLYLCVVVYCTSSNTVHQIVNQSLAHNTKREEIQKALISQFELDELDYILKRSGALIFYHMIKFIKLYLRSDHVYCGGAFDMKSLRMYKSNMNEKEISSFIYSFS